MAWTLQLQHAAADVRSRGVADPEPSPAVVTQVTGAAFSEDGRFVATASEDRTVRVTFL